MSQIEHTKLIFIIHQNEYNSFKEYYDLVNTEDSKEIEYLINQRWATKVKLTFQDTDFLSKYNLDSINHELIEATGSSLKLNYSSLWVRRVNHIYPEHIEIELIPNLISYIIWDFYFTSTSTKKWVNEIGKNTKAKIIYIIENFEYFHLRWHNNQERDFKIGDIDSFNNWIEAFEAYNTAINNVATQNKW